MFLEKVVEVFLDDLLRTMRLQEAVDNQMKVVNANPYHCLLFLFNKVLEGSHFESTTSENVSKVASPMFARLFAFRTIFPKSG